ncbi:type III polyketide synthase [Angustibacter sp. McL0619]|uniref:type III polyketide synthase n=1 Tax=Angustibacter sp. McL0619 TaxID=3415676 RepID=UPI003CE78E4E
MVRLPTGLLSPAHIAAVSSALPDLVIDQREVYEDVFRAMYRGLPRAESIFLNSGVQTRRVMCHPKEWLGDPVPLTGERMKRWAEAAMTLSRRSVASALANIDPASIGSLVFASCTGYDAPSPDILLAKEFGLPATLRRTFVGHMGCYAAFPAIKIGLDALRARPEEQVLIVCTEICSLHARPEADLEQAVCHALFGDASAALVLSAGAGTGPRILRTHTETMYSTADQMGWEVLDDGFRMRLSRRVPASIASEVEGFTTRLLDPLGLAISDVQHWSVHAGGPRIIDAVVRALGLRQEQYQASLDVLADYGNCSSPTSLLVLQRLLDAYRPEPGSTGVLMAFGPGLTMEGLVLRY